MSKILSFFNSPEAAISLEEFFVHPIFITTAALSLLTLIVPLATIFSFKKRHILKKTKLSIKKQIKTTPQITPQINLDIHPAAEKIIDKNRALKEIYQEGEELQNTVLKSPQFQQFYNAMLLSTSKKHFLIKVTKILKNTCSGKFSCLHINPSYITSHSSNNKKTLPTLVHIPITKQDELLNSFYAALTNNISLKTSKLGKLLNQLIPTLVEVAIQPSTNFEKNPSPIIKGAPKKDLPEKNKVLILPFAEHTQNVFTPTSSFSSYSIFAAIHIATNNFSAKSFYFYLQLQKILQLMLKNFETSFANIHPPSSSFFNFSHLLCTINTSEKIFNTTWGTKNKKIAKYLLAFAITFKKLNSKKTLLKAEQTSLILKFENFLKEKDAKKNLTIAFYFHPTNAQLLAITPNTEIKKIALLNTITEFNKYLKKPSAKHNQYENIIVNTKQLSKNFFNKTTKNNLLNNLSSFFNHL